MKPRARSRYLPAKRLYPEYVPHRGYAKPPPVDIAEIRQQAVKARELMKELA